MRSTGADLRVLRMHDGTPSVTLLGGASIAMGEHTGPNANPRAFDTMPAARVIEAVAVVEQTLSDGPLPDPLLFGLHRNQVAAVKTREGAVALVEILEKSKPGPTPPALQDGATSPGAFAGCRHQSYSGHRSIFRRNKEFRFHSATVRCLPPCHSDPPDLWQSPPPS